MRGREGHQPPEPRQPAQECFWGVVHFLLSQTALLANSPCFQPKERQSYLPTWCHGPRSQSLRSRYLWVELLVVNGTHKFYSLTILKSWGNFELSQESIEPWKLVPSFQQWSPLTTLCPPLLKCRLFRSVDSNQKAGPDFWSPSQVQLVRDAGPGWRFGGRRCWR